MRVSRSRVFNRVTSASAFFCGIERYEQDSIRSAALCPRQLRLASDETLKAAAIVKMLY